MAKVTCEYDTLTKEFSVMVDGVQLQDVECVEFYPMPDDEDDYPVCIEMVKKDEATGLTEMRKLCASEGILLEEVEKVEAAPAKYEDLDFTPPEGAREEAKRGLEWRREFNRGGTAVGVARARDIGRGAQLSPSTVRRMASYFARHEVDKKGKGWKQGDEGFPSAGRIAWALWGGDPGKTWANAMVERMNKRDEEAKAKAAIEKDIASYFRG
jgi:hypothetical protein